MRLRQIIRDSISLSFYPIEHKIIEPREHPFAPPIFIVGSPRSGSTLLYQVLTRRFQLCYFSNLMMKFPKSAASIAFLVKPFGGCDSPAQYESQYGETVGWRSPSQGREFWDTWLKPYPHSILVDDVSQKNRRRIVNTILAIQRAYSMPFINKWPRNSLRMDLLAALFPRVFFVHMTRNRDAMISSICRARAAICQEGSGWFSVKPDGYQEILELEELTQVRWQIDTIGEKIADSSSRIDKARITRVTYEDLVACPESVAQQVANAYYSATFYTLRDRHSLPGSFS